MLSSVTDMIELDSFKTQLSPLTTGQVASPHGGERHATPLCGARCADWHANSSDQYSFSSQKDIWRVNQRIVSAVFPTESGFIHGGDVEC